jgi:hypothetical protein
MPLVKAMRQHPNDADEWRNRPLIFRYRHSSPMLSTVAIET